MKRFKKWLIIGLTYWNVYSLKEYIWIFIIVFLTLSSEVWVPYLLGIITWGTPFSYTMFSVGSICWLFWAGPFTPFLPLCFTFTVAIKKIWNRIKRRFLKND